MLWVSPSGRPDLGGKEEDDNRLMVEVSSCWAGSCPLNCTRSVLLSPCPPPLSVLVFLCLSLSPFYSYHFLSLIVTTRQLADGIAEINTPGNYSTVCVELALGR